MPTVSRPMTGEEREIMQAGVDRIYRIFKERVSNGRSKDMDYVETVAKGRVWTGSQALERGLVDQLGGVNDAIELAAEMANLDEYRVKAFPKQKDPFEQLIKELTGEASIYFTKRELGPVYPYFQQIKEIGKMQGIQAKLPFELSIY